MPLDSSDKPDDWRKELGSDLEVESDEDKKDLAAALSNFALVVIDPIRVDWSVAVAASSDARRGATRTVQGEKGKKLVIHDEGVFDPADIPLKRWADYEEELWEQGSNQSIGSIIAHGRRMTTHDDASLYGAASQFNFGGAPASRPASQFFDGRSRRGSQAFDGQSRRGSQFFGSQHGLAALAQSPEIEKAPFGTLPSDEQIAMDVHRVVAQADLATVSKKQVRQQLENEYGIAFGDKTAYVNLLIEQAAMQGL